jgi:hypothetical protein
LILSKKIGSHHEEHGVKILTQADWLKAFYTSPMFNKIIELDRKLERQRIEFMNKRIFEGIHDDKET